MKQIELSRRDLLTRSGLVAAAALTPGLISAAPALAARPDNQEIDGALALKYLIRGNGRVVAGHPIRKSYAPSGTTFESGQWPIAAVLGCADSRVHPNEVFDVAPANLFVVRNAGNVVDDDVLGSLEYAIEHLGARLIVAMGHSSCGAVKATESAISTGTMPGGHVDALVNKIKPALLALPSGHTLQDAVNANAHQSADQIESESSIIEEAVKKGEVLIVSAAFDLKTKKVTFDV